MILFFRENDGKTGARLSLGEAEIPNGSFLYRDGRYIKGGELGTIPAFASHRHAGQTLKHTGVNSASGAFPFDTTGPVTFNRLINAATGSTFGNLTIGSGSIIDSSGAIAFGVTAFTGVGAIGCGAITSSGASTFNSGSTVSDFTVNWVTGVGLFIRGSDGLVGIGTNTPTVNLELVGATHTYAIFEGTGDVNVGFTMVSNSVQKTGFFYRAADNCFKASHAEAGITGATTHLVIKEGKVGIGVIDPDQALEINGSLRHTSDNQYNMYGAANDIGFTYDGTRLRFRTLVGTANFQFDGWASVNTDCTVDIKAGEGSDAILLLTADEADNDGDQWRIIVDAATNHLKIQNYASGAWLDAVDYAPIP